MTFYSSIGDLSAAATGPISEYIHSPWFNEMILLVAIISKKSPPQVPSKNITM
jgi:hypothetical protein